MVNISIEMVYYPVHILMSSGVVSLIAGLGLLYLKDV